MRQGRVAIAALVMLAPGTLFACGWDASNPFDRNAPAVEQALAALDAGDASASAALLEDYLVTGACKEGNIGAPPLLKKRPNGTFDLALSLFGVAEAFGGRFGDEESDAGGQEARQRRGADIGCALSIVQAVTLDPSQPTDLRARARYLEGNLHFLGSDYEQAVQSYDASLTLAPADGPAFERDAGDAGDPVPRNAAWNRSIALRRIDDKKDSGSDAAPPDGGGDGGKNGDGGPPPDAGHDSGSDGGGDSGSKPPDAGAPDSGSDGSAPPPPAPDAGHDAEAPPPPPPPSTRDDRTLDQLENAPTVQQEDAKKHAGRKVRGAADK